MVQSVDVDKIVSYLAPYRDTLPETYTWDVNIDKLVPLGVLSAEELHLANSKTPYEKGIFIKEVVPPVLNKYKDKDAESFYDLCHWIIADWGGIRGFKRANVPALVDTFLASEKPGFERIPSASKVASYLYPERFIAYDSRLAYSLNWAMLFTNASDIFFPIPPGRNTKLASYQMEVLIKLKYNSLLKPDSLKSLDDRNYIKDRDKQLFIPEEEAFLLLMDVIKQVNKKLHPGAGSEKLYLTEILLFSIADKEVFRDISSNVSIAMKH